MAAAPTDPALQIALRDLMRAHAPQATLLASVGQQVLNIQAEGPLTEVPGAELIPPDDWLERGDLAWITRDGALLGLLWCEEHPIPGHAVQVLTLLLTAASTQGASREADMLITQLPVATAWLSAELTFRQVSRTFLELFGLSEAQVVGQSVPEVLRGAGLSEGLIRQLEGAAAGKSLRTGDERLPGGRWVRGEVKPYFGGASAGALWSVQDVSAEYARGREVSALLGGEVPLAVVGSGGEVQRASRGLSALLGSSVAESADAPAGAGSAGGGQAGSSAPIWSAGCFSPEGQAALEALIGSALGGQAGRADVALSAGGRLSLAARPAPGEAGEPDWVVLEGTLPGQGAEQGAIVSQMLNLSEAATVLLDAQGRTQLISEQAANLLGLDAANLTGLSLARLMEQVGLRLHTPQGEPLQMPNLRSLPLPLTREVLLLLPNGTARHVEVRISEMETGGAKKSGLLLSLRDITTLRRTQAKLKHDAAHDALTGLLNRSGLRGALSALTSRGGPESGGADLGGADSGSAESGGAESGGMVACLDIDGFGALNAALSRTAGDLLLIQVAARLNDLASLHGGRAARMADDTFAVYLRDVSAEIGAQKIQALLREPLRTGRRLVPVTFSLGAAAVQLSSPEVALADAEVALLHAKRQGRASLAIFQPGLRDEQAQNFQLEESLRAVLTAGEAQEQFSLLYQPSVSLKDGRVLGAEALLRWTHPEFGNVSPARFLPIASRSELITAISEWVVREASRGRVQVREASGLKDWRTSINLSLEELRREGGVERLLPLMSKPGALDIEVSAGSLLHHSEETLGLLEALRSKGSRLLVDDFGDGASSLTALTQFPLSGVKLHPTLTARLPDDQKTIKLVQGTVGLAHSLGLSVTAVGVETYAQLDILRDLGCNAAQGFALTPPLTAPDLVTWLQNR